MGSARAVELHDYLWEAHGIEVAVFGFRGGLFVRVCVQLHVTGDMLRALADAVDAAAVASVGSGGGEGPRRGEGGGSITAPRGRL